MGTRQQSGQTRRKQVVPNGRRGLLGLGCRGKAGFDGVDQARTKVAWKNKAWRGGSSQGDGYSIMARAPGLEGRFLKGGWNWKRSVRRRGGVYVGPQVVSPPLISSKGCAPSCYFTDVPLR